MKILRGQAEKPESSHDLGIEVPHSEDSDPVARRRMCRGVEVVQQAVLASERETRTYQLLLDLHRMRWREQAIDARGVLLTTPHNLWQLRSEPSIIEAHRGNPVGDASDDAEASPQSARAGQRDSMRSEVDDILDRAGNEDRKAQRPHLILGRDRKARRLRSRIVADTGEDTATGRRPHVLCVSNRIGGAIQARRLRMPHPHYAVEAWSLG